ncbi:o-succinylbenzoate--CoA ligase [Arthrobacter sp. H14]|uniref:o-succinylbenzoate--CoA ligase n=1 Tax=Arthrobacter sp. H14 TaxID=1312959 RepID=UPI00047CBCE4|nr:o-succinylbenzoate--CoA ligase [Arthrobacter sp. H14]
MDILPIHTPAGFNPLDLLKPLAAVLAGEGPVVAPYATDEPPANLLSALSDSSSNGSAPTSSNGSTPETRQEPAGAPSNTAVIISTSGSTGQPKQTMLSVESLAASSMATAFTLRGEGQWLSALPVHYVAGLQVLVRSLYAGTKPAVMDMSGGFDTDAFTYAAEEMTDHHRYVSLVPTQLHRLLDSPDPSTMSALRRFNAILLGGGPASPDLLGGAAGEGLKVVTTYGMSETCGGCIYNGRPIDGVKLRLEDGRIRLGGDVVASGYLNQPELTRAHFREEDGTRWYITDDLGEFYDDGKLRVLGRMDDVVITGGLKISANSVREAIEAVDGVESAFVAGIESAEWGHVVAAAVVASPANQDAVSAAVRRDVAAEAVPKVIEFVAELPTLPTGKPDRQQLIRMLEESARGHRGE